MQAAAGAKCRTGVLDKNGTLLGYCIVRSLLRAASRVKGRALGEVMDLS